MKRGINFYEAIFLVLFVCKGLGQPFFGVTPPWVVVFLPFLAMVAVGAFSTFSIAKGWNRRFEFWLWKLALKFTISRKKKQARKIMQDLPTTPKA
jgi:hypothetical protein